MAVYETKHVVTTTLEVSLPSPVNWAELGKATAHIMQVLKARDIAPSDDAAWLEARDDELVFKVPIKVEVVIGTQI